MDKKFILLKLTSDKNDVLEIGKDSEYRLLDIEGIESSDYEVNIVSNIQYDGGSVINKSIKSRPISIRFEESNIKNMEDNRQKLISFFNPKYGGKLEVNYCGIKREIRYEVESFKGKLTGVYESSEFMVDFICPDPFLRSPYLDIKDITPLFGGVSFSTCFPFSLNKTKDGLNGSSYGKAISNPGDVDTPVEISISGPANTPVIKNSTTGEFIKVNQNVKDGEELYITTGYGEKKVEKLIYDDKNQVRKRENAFSYIDLDSKFFELVPGTNVIEYSSENILSQRQKAVIKFQHKYLGI